VLETQTLSLWKPIAELEETRTVQEMPKEEQETSTKQTPILAKEICFF